MKNRIKTFVCSHIDTIFVALFMTVVFSYIMFLGFSDLQAHADIAMRMLREHRLFENNFLMYLMAIILTGFTGALVPTRLAIVLLIVFSNTTKYVLVRNEMSETIPLRYAKMASLALLFVFVVPVFYFLKIFGVFLNANTMYLGYYVPNVWHNSTILCMMPFAIMTFFFSVRQFDKYDGRRNGLITLFVVLATLVKPSFFFIYVVAYPICMFVKYRFNKEFFYSFIPILAGCACVVYEYLSIYDGEDGSGVVISVMPLFTLAFWKSHIEYFAASILFPVLFVLFYWKEIRHDYEFWFVLIMLVVALGIKWCCAETGERALHGNFGWQVIAAMWFVFYYMLKIIFQSYSNYKDVKKIDKTNRFGRKKSIVFLGIYGVHVVMGLVYLIKFLVTNSYA